MTELRDGSRRLAGVDPAVTAAFVEALSAADAQFGAVSGRLESMRVHDQAFGKLIDAAKVRDAYHERLPATERNLAEACAVLRHFIGEFTGTGAGAAELAVVEASVEAASHAPRGEHAAASREARIGSEALLDASRSAAGEQGAPEGGAVDATSQQEPEAPGQTVQPSADSEGSGGDAPVLADEGIALPAEPARTADAASTNARSDTPPPAVSAAGAAAAAAAASLIAPRPAVEP